MIYLHSRFCPEIKGEIGQSTGNQFPGKQGRNNEQAQFYPSAEKNSCVVRKYDLLNLLNNT